MQQTVEGIIAEIDDLVLGRGNPPPYTKTASACNSADGVTDLVEKLAQAADALDSGTSLTSMYAGTFNPTPSRPSTEQRILDKIAEAQALSSAMQVVGSVGEALEFSKTAATKGHDGLEAFKFFFQQKLKGIGA